jgi:PAS domain-containing protein
MENIHASVADGIFVAEPGRRIIDVDSATSAILGYCRRVCRNQPQLLGVFDHDDWKNQKEGGSRMPVL